MTVADYPKILGSVSVLLPSILEQCIPIIRFAESGNVSVDEDFNVIRLNQYYRFYDVWVNPKDLALYIDDPTCLVFNADLALVVYWYRFFSLDNLKLLCRSHGIRHGQQTKAKLGDAIYEHKCLERCSSLVYVFKSLSQQRRHISKFFESRDERFQFSYAPSSPRDAVDGGGGSTQNVSEAAQGLEPDANVDSRCNPPFTRPSFAPTATDGIELLHDHDHLKPPDRSKKESIIREWQEELDVSNQFQVVCAACAIQTSVRGAVFIPSSDVDITLLRNNFLPPRVLPTSYNFTSYKRAILHPLGLETTECVGRIRFCVPCHRSLKSSKMPKFALCNWLYYGRDELPADVCDAFGGASIFDKMLVCRARANTITCRFNTRAECGAGTGKDSALQRARKGVRGNVLVAPLDVVKMNTVVPPCPRSIRDTMCAVFIGKTIPTRETLHFYKPVLVRRTRVKRMIEFLMENNSHYKPDESFQYSEDNLNGLLGTNTGDVLPYGLHVGYMEGNDAIESTVADYTPRNEDEDGGGGECYDELLMENVGYTDGDDSPLAYLQMKSLALSRCIQGKPFIASGTGPQNVPDFKNPSIMTWLFPHLDPWGIGGFYHPGRTFDISMFDQLCHLLKTYDSPFQRDPEFAFVFHNVCRKAMVAQSLRFTVARSVYRKVASDLLNIDPDVLACLNDKCQADPYYKAQGEGEKRVFKLLSDIRTVSKRLPGSDGYKIMLRNEIRALISYKGTPTLFVTINPSDVDHPLVRVLGGGYNPTSDAMIALERGEELTKWQRSLFAAKNPSACAKFFHLIVTQFIDVVLRYGRDDEGLYGKCSAYYGTVEAQGKGTLHCHMLVWLNGHLSPQDLKEAMAASDVYRDKVLGWMESVVSCEFPGSLGVDQQANDHPRRVLSKDTGDPHPGVIAPPAIANYRDMGDFWRDFDHFLGRVLHQFAWHEHQATCWKYIKRGQAKTDENCRMGMDGTTRDVSCFDTNLNEIILRRHHPKIAPYTDVVSFLMQCNMDIKFVGSGEAAKAFLYYVTDYITKASLTVHVGMSALSYAIKKIYTKVPAGTNSLSDTEAKGAVITAVNSMMGRQEISQPQVMSYLVGGGDHYTSHDFVILQWSAFRRPMHVRDDTSAADRSDRDDVAASVSLTLGDKSITVSSQYMDYIFRSNNVKFDNLCLYDFVSWTVKVAYHKSGERTASEVAGAFINSVHPQYSSHYLSLRRRGRVPVVLGPSIPNPDKSAELKDEWSRDMMILFKPWRDLKDLRSDNLSWSEEFSLYKTNVSPFHRKIMKNMRALTECSEARDRHRDRRHGKPPNDTDRGQLTGDEFSLEETWGLGDAGLESYENLDPFSVLEYEETSGNVPGSTRVGGILDDVSSRLLDVCLPLKMEDIVQRAEVTDCLHELEPAGVEMVSEIDLPRLAQHSAIMQMKRRRECSDSATDFEGGAVDRDDALPRRRLSVQDPVAEIATIRPVYRQTTVEKGYAIADSVVDDMGLRDNDRQLKAFNIIARQAICERPDQLLMHVAGVGGTGKSHVIRAVVLLFERLGRRRELLLGAPTGIAAVLIQGHTLHSLISLNPSGKRVNVTQLVDTWKYVKFLIVDEVSMVGARFMSQMSSRMRQGKGDDAIGRGKPFGGVNVIFMGDFGQLKPPRQYALYANELVKSPSFAESRNDKGIGAMDGVFLWRQVRTVVELVKNQRHSGDPKYAAFLERLRVGRCIENGGDGVSDLDYLRTRLIENQVSDLCVVQAFRDAPIIVGSKSLRDLLNVKLVRYHAKRNGQEPVLYFSSDTVNRVGIDGRIQDKLWGLPSSVNKEAFGKLPLFIGMKVMITENLAFGNGVVNGSEGYVTEIKYDEDDRGRRYAKVVYVQIPGCGISIDGLGIDIVPIFPVLTRIEHGIRDRRFTSKAFSRRQVPLVPAYVYTDYKSQGRTLPRVIVDLSTARGQGVYVMLSRVKSLSGLLILRWFPPSKIYHRLSEELRVELTRIGEIASTTESV